MNMKFHGFPLHKLFTGKTKLGSTRPRNQAARPRGRTLLSVEELESRLAPSIYTVMTAGNATGPVSGSGGVFFTAPTLRAALDAANLAGGSNTIKFASALAGATITLTSNDTNSPFAFGPTALVIGIGTAPHGPKTDNITIQGPSGKGITISGNGARRVFGVLAGSGLTLQNITITGGKALGGDGNAGGGGGGGMGGA